MNSLSVFFKKYSHLLVYIAAALLAISDTGYYWYVDDYIGSYTLATLLRRVALLLLFCKVSGTRYSLRQFLVIFGTAILALYNYHICGSTTFIYCVLFIAAMKKVDYSVLFKALFGATTASLLVFSILSLFGIGDVVSITMYFGRDGIETRYCWGMHHPNIWHFAFARCIIYFVLGYDKHLKWYGYFALLIMNYIAYHYTVSRTGFLATAAFLLVIFLYKYFDRILHTIIIKVSIVLGIIGIYGAFLYFMHDYTSNQSQLALLVNDKLTTGRIHLAAYYLSMHPIKFWGSEFWYGIIFDCGFLRLFYDNGYLLGGIFFAAFFALLILALKNNWDMVVSACIFVVLYSIYEIDPITRPTYNVMIPFFAILIFQNQFKEFQTLKKGVPQDN